MDNAGIIERATAAELRPAMTAAEEACLRRHLSMARYYLEFGAGGSTLAAVEAGVPRIASVESDPRWLARLRADPGIADAEQAGRLLLHHGDIGPAIGRFGRPGSDEHRDRWPNYYTTIWNHVAGELLDLVLIDGRFRVASALSTLIRCRADTLLMIHDLWNRPAYHPLLPYLDWVESVDSLGVFRPRDCHVSKLRAALEPFALTPS